MEGSPWLSYYFGPLRSPGRSSYRLGLLPSTLRLSRRSFSLRSSRALRSASLCLSTLPCHLTLCYNWECNWPMIESDYLYSHLGFWSQTVDCLESDLPWDRCNAHQSWGRNWPAEWLSDWIWDLIRDHLLSCDYSQALHRVHDLLSYHWNCACMSFWSVIW